jgi:photosystem II stability/assembly factor-like uncharacterized protein
MYRSPAPSNQVLVGTIQGVVCLERDPDGEGWLVASRAIPDQHIHALLIEPESGTIFAGMNNGSIFASTDGGRTWEPVRHGFPDRLQTAFEAMCLEDWGESFSIFAATATGEVWCSDDGGEHWTEAVRGLASLQRQSLRRLRHGLTLSLA